MLSKLHSSAFVLMAPISSAHCLPYQRHLQALESVLPPTAVLEDFSSWPALTLSTPVPVTILGDLGIHKGNLPHTFTFHFLDFLTSKDLDFHSILVNDTPGPSSVIISHHHQ